MLLFGLAGVFGKLLPVSPLLIVAGRTVFAALTLAIWSRLKGHSFRLGSTLDGAILFLLGGILAVHWVTFFHSIQVSTVAVGLISFATFPVFVTFLEPLFFRESLRPFDILTAAGVFLGLVLVVPSLEFGHQVTRGVFWGVISGLTFALLSILNRKYVRRYSPELIALYQNATAALWLLPFALPGMPLLSGRDILLLLLLGVLCTALSHALFIHSLRYVRAQLASVTACLEPVYGVLLALALLGEVPGWQILAGGAVILSAALAASLKSR